MSNKPTEFVSTMVKAGAGAGKTYGLIQKIVDLVREYSSQNEQKLPRFVVTTFTRKATQEVRERLLTKALELRLEDPVFGDLFLNFLKSSGFLLVSTIHGVLNQFLRQYGAIVGLDPDFSVTTHSHSLLTKVLHELLEDNQETMNLVKKYGWRNIKYFLIEYHRASIFNPNLTELPPSHFIQYWTQKLINLKLQVSDLSFYIEPMLSSAKTETLPKFQSCLKEMEQRLNENSDIWKKLECLKEIYERIPRNLGPLKQWDDSYKEMRIFIMDTLAALSEDLLTNRENFELHYKDVSILQELGKQFSQKWLKRKIQLGELEMEDLELLSLYILRNHALETKAFSESWNYWFIDEYQDTSPIQVEILNTLINTCPHYVVGDPQQSIYFFRGARSKVFHEKLSAFKESSAIIEEKKINRRSRTPTLHFINDLMDLVNKQQFTPMDSLKELESKDLMVGNFYLISEDNEDQHLNSVIMVLKKLINESVSPSQIAILCRENNELQKVFSKIKAAELPAQIYSKGRFLEDRQVKDALSLWRFLVNPNDDINLIELLRTEWFKVPDSILMECATLKASENSDCLWSQVKKVNLNSITTLNSALMDLSSHSHFNTWLELIINSTAFLECTKLDFSGRKEANLWKLISTIHDAIMTGALNYVDPLDIALQVENNNENEAQAIRDSHQIQLMTIHGSKGLEFEHVILPFLNHTKKKESGGFFNTDLETQYWVHSFMDEKSKTTQSHYFSRIISEEINNLLDEESDRLFYVAITRAKKSLHFFCPHQVEKLSKSGWARHLRNFLSKGPGLYISNSSQYEFQIIDLEDLNTNDKNFPQQAERILELTLERQALPKEENRLDAVQAVARNPLIENSLVAQLPFESMKHTTITELVNDFQKGIDKDNYNDIGDNSNKVNNNSNTNHISHTLHFDEFLDWNMLAIKKGIQIHREFERASSGKNLQYLSKESLHFLESVSFPLQELLLSGNPEWPFCIEISPSMTLEGQIDLWGRDQFNQLWIVDYKTGSDKYKEKALKQMKLYAFALLKTKQMKTEENVKLAVCYPIVNKYFIYSYSGFEISSIV